MWLLQQGSTDDKKEKEKSQEDDKKEKENEKKKKQKFEKQLELRGYFNFCRNCYHYLTDDANITEYFKKYKQNHDYKQNDIFVNLINITQYNKVVLCSECFLPYIREDTEEGNNFRFFSLFNRKSRGI